MGFVTYTSTLSRPAPKNISAAIPSKASYRLYHDVMRLIEEVNHYLHGEGRLLMRDMQPDVARFYIEQAMQLSNRLMQTAGLLLLVRAVVEGDMNVQDMERERAKIIATAQPFEEQNPLWAEVPEAFCALNQKSLSLSWQVSHLLHKGGEDNGHYSQGKNAVAKHMDRLKNSFPNSF